MHRLVNKPILIFLGMITLAFNIVACVPIQEEIAMAATAETTIEKNKALVQAFSDAEDSRDYDALDTIVAEDFVRHSAATPDVIVTSRDDLKAFFAANAAAFSDYTTTTKLMVAEGDMVAVYATFAGTMDGPLGDIPPTGNSAEMPFVAFFRIEDGLIAELWAEWDNINFLSQLGLFPADGS